MYVVISVNKVVMFPLKTAEVVVVAPAVPMTFEAATSGQM